MLPHPLINFETQRYYQKKPKLNGFYSRNNLRKMKDGYLDEYTLLGTYWIALCMNKRFDKRI